MRNPFIAAVTAMWKGTAKQVFASIALLCAVAGAQAQTLQIAGANSDGNALYDLTQSSTGLITGTSALDTDASKHGGFESLVWVPNAATGTLDLVVADPKKQQIVRYTGPKYGTSTTIYSWAGVGHGPAQPEALSVDASGNIFVVSSSCGADGTASLWVLPVNKQGGYGTPVLIDHTFNWVKTSTLAETLVAGTSTNLWNAGDLLVLVGDASDARVLVYSQKAIAGVIANPSKPLTGPTSTAVPWSKFAPTWAVPVGMDIWPADSTHGTSLLITTVDGRILRYDTSWNIFDANFASGLGSGLEKIKTGLSAGVEYAFVSQVQSGNEGKIMQFGAPPSSGSNRPVATITKGLSDPIGLAVATSGSVPATSCVSPDPACTFLGGALTLEISGPGSSKISGNILEQSCVVQNDPRVTVAGSAWSCNGQTLDVSTLCPGFPSTILPGSLCGHSGPSGSGFVVLKGTADGVDPVDNNTQIVAQSNINAILPGPLNQNCNPVAAYAWAPRPDLHGVEGTIVEDALTPYFIDLTGFCDEPGVIQRGASMTSFGLALNTATSGLPNGLPGYVDSKYTNLLSTVGAASITSSVAANLDTYIHDSETEFNAGVAGAPNGFSCAAYWDDYADSYVRANLPAFSSNLTGSGGNPNPAFEISGRLANLFLTIETRAAGLAANTTWPPANVPACVTLSAASASVPAGTATTLSWTALGVPTGSSCALSGGTFTNRSEPASGSVSTGNLTSTGSPYTFELVCPGTGTATSFATATVAVTAATTAPVPNVVGLSQTATLPAAKSALTNAGFALGTVTTQSSATVPAGNVIRQNPAAGSTLAKGSAVNLVVSTGPTVPNVAGLTQTAASTALTAAGLKLGTVTTAASTTVAVGLVISQTPASGTSAAIGAAVNIVVSSGETVPNVVGLTQSAASTAITNAGFKLGTVTTQSSTTVPTGNVINQTPAGGTSATGGTPVNITVSSGTAVPNVVNLTQAAATTAITTAGFKLGAVATQSSTTVPTGSVISELPTAGTIASPASNVNITVSSGTTVPNVVGATQASASTSITNAGLVVGAVTTQSSTTVATGSVIAESPTAGTLASPGSKVNITVSSGTTVPNVVGATQASASTSITNAGLVVGIVTSQSSTTVATGSVISESPLAGTSASPGSAVNIIVSSGTGVPLVIGLTQAAATSAITGAGFVVGSDTTQSSTTVATGSVISESPTAGTIASPGSKVNIVVSSGTTVPVVVNLTQAAASTAITGAGLVVGTVTNQASTTVPTGSVISESPLGGAAASPGSGVNIVVSSGTTVPVVVNLTQDAASTAITNAGLVVGTVTTQSSTTVATGSVISESPLGGTAESPGFSVDLVVSTGPATINTFSTNQIGYTTGSEALLTWTTSNESSNCTLSATDGTYTTPTAVQANGAVYTGQFTTNGTYTATLTCPDVATPVTLTLNVSVPMPLINLQGLVLSPSNGNLYVTGQSASDSDSAAGEVLVYAPSPFGMIQQTSQTIGPNIAPSTYLEYPQALAFDTSGNLYVADGGSDQIFVMSLSATGVPTLLNTITLPSVGGYYCSPVGIAVDGQGYLYVSCTGGYNGSAILVYESPLNPVTSTSPTLTWTGDSSDSFFSNLFGMALDGQTLLVGVSYDYTTSQVVAYKLSDLQSVAHNSEDGGASNLPVQLTITPPPVANNNGPESVNIAVDGSGNIYIGSTYVAYAESGIPYYPTAFASYGPITYPTDGSAPSAPTQTNPSPTSGASTYLQAIPSYQPATPNPLLAGPGGVAVDVSGLLYVADSSNNTIDVYAAGGNTAGNYQYDFQPIITLTATTLDGSYLLTWTSLGIEPSTAQCSLTTGDGTYSGTPEPAQNPTTGVSLGLDYGYATLSCPGAVASVDEYEGE
jgi:beta-lactam-binding protein with PASTA domain/sugar lactone lactonase YvrE